MSRSAGSKDDDNYGNNVADGLVCFGSRRTLSASTPRIVLTATALSTVRKQDTLQTLKWKNCKISRQNKFMVTKPSKKIAKFCLRLLRDDLRKLMSIWTELCRINKYLYRMGVVGDFTCRE